MSQSVFIIAEAGVNHNGDIEKALRLIDAAAKSGADAVKFQTFRAERNISAAAPKARYQQETTGADESQLDMVRKLELSREQHFILRDYTAKAGIIFLSTPFDPESIDFLAELDLPVFKIPSGEITNLPHLRRVGSLGKPVILSTGMASLGEIESALEILVAAGTPLDAITVLHCNTQYPTPPGDVNLLAMTTIAQAFGVAVGYSDHTLGIEVPIAAAALGARVIEKHFTLDRNLPGPDHRASLEPDELSAMVNGIRIVEQARGTGFKRPSPSERENRSIVRKSIYYAHDLPAGHILKEADLAMKRPGTGISPMEYDQVVGRTLRIAVLADSQVSWAQLKSV